MNLELVDFNSEVRGQFWAARSQPANDKDFDAEGNIVFEQVEGFLSPLKKAKMLEKLSEKNEQNADGEELAAAERDTESRVYSNSINMSLISKILCDKYLDRPELREIYFTIKSGRQRVAIEANINGRDMVCFITCSSKDLRSELEKTQGLLVSEIRNKLRIKVELCISEQISFNRI